ncbi:titin isoform X2 [Anopheles gambiae]|uniref:titin isoform X2 n=1 Tax=Anopheles gambiae TaxID=7165 RepID=UPI002AC9BD39|nr:titin isoform X2 [Anopheles gambiae]
MPLYSELYHNFVGNTPIIPSPMVSVGSSTYSPPTYVGVSRAFPNPLSVAGSRTAPSFARGYVPKLTPITETPLTSTRIAALGRVSSPKFLAGAGHHHSHHTHGHTGSPTYQKPRRIINTADIDVSASKYAGSARSPALHTTTTIAASVSHRASSSPTSYTGRAGSPPDHPLIGTSGGVTNTTTTINLAEMERPSLSARDQELSERSEQRRARSTINRNRTVVRLNTIRARSKSRGSRGSTEGRDRHALPDAPTTEPTFDEEMLLLELPAVRPGGTTSSWRDNFRDELSLRPRTRTEPSKSPGELLLEKHLIRDGEPGTVEPYPPTIRSPVMKRRGTIRRKSAVKIPSFHEICADISSDKLDDDLNAGELRRRASQLIEDELLQFQEELKKAAGGAATLAPDTLEERLKEALEQQLAQDSGVEVAEKRKLKKIKRTRTKVLPVASVAGADVEAPPEPKREEEEAVVVVENAVAPRIVAELESIEECTVFKLPKKKKKQPDEGGPATGPGGARKDVPEVQVVIRDQPEPNGAQGPSKQASTAGASEATVDGAGPVDATTPRKTAKTGIKTYVRKKTVEALPEPVQVETVKLVAEPEGKVKVEPTSNGLAKSIEMPPLQKIQAMDRSVDMGEKPAAKKQSDIPAKLGDDKSSEEVKRCVEGSSVTTVDSSQAKLPERKVPTTEAIKLVTSEKQEVTPKQTAQSIEVKKMPSSDPPIPKQPESLANLAKKPTMPLQTDGKVPRTTTEALKLVNNAKQEVAPKQAAQLPEVKKIPPSEPPSPKQPESPASLAKKLATLVQPDSKTSATVTPTIARTDQQPTNESISKLSQPTKPKLEQLPAEPANKSPLTKPKLDETPAKLAPAKLGLVRKKPTDLKRSTDEVDFWSTIGTRETVSFARRKQQLVALRSTEEEESPPASPSQPYQGMPGSPKVGLVGRSKLQEAQLVGSPKSPTEGKSVFTLPDPKAAEESAMLKGGLAAGSKPLDAKLVPIPEPLVPKAPTTTPPETPKLKPKLNSSLTLDETAQKVKLPEEKTVLESVPTKAKPCTLPGASSSKETSEPIAPKAEVPTVAEASATNAKASAVPEPTSPKVKVSATPEPTSPKANVPTVPEATSTKAKQSIVPETTNTKPKVTTVPEPSSPKAKQPTAPEPSSPKAKQPAAQEPSSVKAKVPTVPEPVSPNTKQPTVSEPTSPKAKQATIPEPFLPKAKVPTAPEPISPKAKIPTVPAPTSPKSKQPAVPEPTSPKSKQPSDAEPSSPKTKQSTLPDKPLSKVSLAKVPGGQDAIPIAPLDTKKLSPKELIKAIAPNIAAAAEKRLAQEKTKPKEPKPEPIGPTTSPTGTTVPVTTTATAGPTTDGKQPDEPPTKKVIAKKVVKVVKTKVTAGSKPKPEPEADVQAEREQEQRRLAQQQQQQQQNLERMKTKLNQITLNMGVKGMEVEVKECQKCQSAIVYEALPVPAAIVTTPKMTPAPPSATSKQPSANGAKLTKNKFGTLANLSDLSAVDGRDRHTTQAVQSKQKPQTPTEQQQQQQKVFLSSSDEENGEAAKQRPAAGVSVGARVANDSASETSFSGVEDDWSSEEEDDEDDEMANDKPEKKKPFDPTKRVKLNFEQMRKCYSKEEKSPIVLVARPRPLWKVKRHGHRHNRKADLTSSSSSGSGSSSCSEDESTSTSTTTSSGATTSTTGRTSSEAVSTMDGATSDIATDSSVNSSTGGKQGKGAKGAQAKGKGAKGKPDPFGDIYDNPMVIPLHAEPRTSSRKSGGSFVAPLRDENNNTPADLDEDERARSIGAGHEVRSASTSSHDSGFYGGGTAPISPKKALETSYTYAQFQKTGKLTAPATVIPRFRKYNVDDFHFLTVLGKGSFGKVFLAELKNSDYYYAIKCLKKDVVLEDDDVDCTLIERKVLALGTKHPFLCHLFCTFQTDSHLFFVMEYLNGGDLMFHIQQSGRFPEARARFYAAEIVSGLKFLHRKGIVYRDLKLDNVLLDYDGHVRIADFGMCKLEIYLDKLADSFCGTPDYMAPEIIKGQKYNQAVDWWSFGVLVYEMLVGQSPFSGCDEDELFWSICNEIPWFPHYLSKEALRLLQSLLEKDASIRLGVLNTMDEESDIKYHPFFNSIIWDKLERRAVEPPFKPQVRHPLDTQYFDKQFTRERARLTPIDRNILASMDQAQFEGFTYTNPNNTLTQDNARLYMLLRSRYD